MHVKEVGLFLSLIFIIYKSVDAKRNYFYDFVVESYKNIVVNYRIENSPYLLGSKILFGKPQSLTMIMNFNWDGTSDFMLGNQDGVFWSDIGIKYIFNFYSINSIIFKLYKYERQL
jgi:hypothetical protein